MDILLLPWDTHLGKISLGWLTGTSSISLCCEDLEQQQLEHGGRLSLGSTLEGILGVKFS